MEILNTLNLTRISGGTKLKQGDFGSVLSYSLADENGQEITSFDTKTAYINLVLDDKILFTTTTQVDISRVTFHIDKALPIGLYYLEIKVDDYVFPSDKDSVILIEEGATAYDLKDLIPNYDINMTITGILSDLSQKGIDINDLKNKMSAIYNNALFDHAEILNAKETFATLDSRLDELDAEDSDLQNQINVNKASINTTNSRLDNLVATAGNGNSSELSDMRVATNGAVFDTAGNAERTQINILYNELDDISIKSTNIFDKKKVKPNTYISYLNGIEIANSTYSASDFIFIKPNTTYYTNFIDQLAFYDSQKKYISGENLNRQTNTMVSPSNAVYLRLTVPTAKLDAFQINEGSALLFYSEGGRKIGIGSFEQSLKNKISLFDSNYKVSSNLFDKRTAINKYYINYTTGVLTLATSSPETWFASDWISIEPNTNYTTKYSQWIAFYDINKVYISGLGIGHATTFTSPANAYFLRLSTKNNEIDSEQLNKGDVLSNYDIGGVIRSYQDGKPLVKPSSIFYDAISHPKGARPRIKLIGDSITAGVGATGFAEDGDAIVDSGHKMSIDDNSWAQKLKTLLSTLNVDVINWGISGWNSGQIISNISKLAEDSDDLVILQIGTNDRHNFPSYQSTYNNILGIVQYLRRRGIPCILMSAIPATVSGDNDAIRNYGMFEVNYAIGKVAFNSGMDYISNYDALFNYEELTGRNLDEFIGDGLHPNDLGYAYMFKNITRQLGLSYRRDGIIPKNN